MKVKTIIFLLLLIAFCDQKVCAQSGANFSFSLLSFDNENLPNAGKIRGWDIKLAARLGKNFLFVSPELIYQNTNVIPNNENNFFDQSPRIHTLRIPVSFGGKIRTFKGQRIFAKAGVIGSYILSIDKNALYGFEEMKDIYGGWCFNIGYDLYFMTFDYRFERSLQSNFSNKDVKLGSHSFSLGINF